MLTLGNSQLKLLEQLCNAMAVSGDEGEVRAIVLEAIKGHVDECRVDALGNVLAVRKCRQPGGPRVMVAAHMDEVGFMLVDQDGDGIYRFETVGGVDVRQLVGKPVWVGKSHLPGVIGARPIHLTTPDERRRAIPLDSLRIDIGPEGKAKLGDRAVFATRFQRQGPVLIAKALDNRLGVASLIELLKHAPGNVELLAAFTVQEENGLRGAKVAAHAFDPQAAIIMDSTPAYDLPTWDGEENIAYNTRLGDGPAIYTADSSTFSDPRLVRHILQTSREAGLPCQLRQPGGGGTDAGTIHKSRAGIPSVSISVPHRYSHTAASIALIEDWKNALNLVRIALETFSSSILSEER